VWLHLPVGSQVGDMLRCEKPTHQHWSITPAASVKEAR
jgi:hypothetical protein